MRRNVLKHWRARNNALAAIAEGKEIVPADHLLRVGF
jgi:hypothetical protein